MSLSYYIGQRSFLLLLPCSGKLLEENLQHLLGFRLSLPHDFTIPEGVQCQLPGLGEASGNATGLQRREHVVDVDESGFDCLGSGQLDFMKRDKRK